MPAEYLNPTTIEAELNVVLQPTIQILHAIPGTYGNMAASFLEKLDDPEYLTAAIDAINAIDGAQPPAATK